MNFSHFFIARPIFATVISVITVILGSLAYATLPVEQYPQVAPPTVQVTAQYPGANAETVAETVATPLEQEINGVENMLYIESNSSNSGSTTITVTFELGTDLDEAQVQVQNRVAIAEPRLPETVRRLGVTTLKNSPDLMMVVNMFSKDGTYDQTYIANYAALKIRDQIARVNGIGEVRIFGAGEYAMRIWIDPDKAASLGISAGEVVSALRGQNIQVAGGTLNQPPAPTQGAYEFSVQTQGRLKTPEEFGNVIVKSGDSGRLVRVRDLARVELGAQTYATKGFLGKFPAVALPLFQRPGTNAIETADAVIELMKKVSADFPPGLDYEIAYNPTEFVEQSVDAVVDTIFEATALVVLVIFVFLQSLRISIIPIIAIPVSLIGTFAVMAALDFSLNNLTLFGLVLAIGIVVDDAIVVVENMERNIREGLAPFEAARKSMTEVGGAIIATSLVLVAVFLPTTFLEGISGQFYRQFGVTIAVATVISSLVSLTLTPAMAAIFMRPQEEEAASRPSGSYLRHPIRSFFYFFNRAIDSGTDTYTRFVRWSLGAAVLLVFFFIGLLALTVFQFARVPGGFIPTQDQGYFIVGVSLPPGASLARTNDVMGQVQDALLDMDGVATAVSFSGFSGATFSTASNAGAVFPVLEAFEKRSENGLTYDSILAEMRQRMNGIRDAYVVVIPPPPVRGVGRGGGFKMMVQDTAGAGLEALNQSAWALIGAASQEGGLENVFTFFDNKTPQLYVDIDRAKAERLGIPLQNVFNSLEVYLGSAFVNDFNFLGRTFQVVAQADFPYRVDKEDILDIRVKDAGGQMTPDRFLCRAEVYYRTVAAHAL